MMVVKLAKACRRREKGAPMLVTERLAYQMMKDGEVNPDDDFMLDFEQNYKIRAERIPKAPRRGRPKRR